MPEAYKGLFKTETKVSSSGIPPPFTDAGGRRQCAGGTGIHATGLLVLSDEA